MFRYSRVLGCLTLQLVVAGIVAAQERPNLGELPNAPLPRLERIAASNQESVPSPKQESGQVPKQEGAKPEDARQKREGAFRSTVEILERRSVFFPELAASSKPLRPRQKFELFADQSIAPSRILSSLAGAGIGQAADFLPAYGQGADGYAKRFGSSMASQASTNFFGTFLLPSMLHDDPRYFVKLHADLGHRIGYALSRLVVTRKDDGAETTNWPGMIAPLLAESLANTYLPMNERTAGRTFQRYGVRMGLTAAANMAKEYWPTIFRNLRITKTAPSGAATQPLPPGRK
jgi:hypothetical protein